MSTYVCPYCDSELPELHSPCCGEVGHAVEVDEAEVDAPEIQEPQIVQATVEKA